MTYFDTLKDDIDQKIRFTGRGGTAHFINKLPPAYHNEFTPTIDTDVLLKRGDFALPDILVWYPEAKYRSMYPTARPKCPFCKRTDCVIRKGWVKSPRHGYARGRVVAIIGLKYACKSRKAAGIRPYFFRSPDGYESESNLVEASNDVVGELNEIETGKFASEVRLRIFHNISHHLARQGVDDRANVGPASAQWLAARMNRYRSCGKVRGETQWAYFKQEYLTFQGAAGQEADSYSSINFSAFADSWNDYVAKLGHNEQPQFTYKSACQLKEAFKKLDQRARRHTTLLAHSEDIAQLREQHTGSAGNEQFVQGFATAVAPTQATVRTMEVPVMPPAEESDEPSGRQRRRKGRRRKNSNLRCRMCGNPYALPQWRDYHKPQVPSRDEWQGRAQDRVLRNSEGNKVWDLCTCPVHLYADGYPCLEGPMPRRKKPRQNL